ncbi:MAG: histidinol-phosphate transaminase [Betaproteobacteria bacterium]|nr:histidinol-phosphate transaminase [Betaproteobacteria bacterium]
MCCPPGARRVLLRRWGFTISRSAAASSRYHAKVLPRWAKWPRSWRNAKGWWRTRVRQPIAWSVDLDDCIRGEIRALKAYEVPSAQGMVKLDAMENPYGLPETLRADLARHLASLDLNRYPDANPEALKTVLRQAMGIPPEAALVLGNGSDELIQMLALAVAKPGAVVLGVEPSFVMFRMIAAFVGMRYVGVGLRPDFSLDGPSLLEAVRSERPALTFLAYPNNPTGNHFDPEVVESVIRTSPGLVVVDEAYYPFTDRSFLPRLLSHPNLLVMRTVSKLGLAGIRLGLVAGPAAVLGQIDKVRLPYNISVLDQAAALEVLSRPGVLQEQAARICEQRAVLAEGLSRLAGVTVYPSAANFLLFRVAQASRVFEGLRQRGILIKNLSAAHPSLADCLRVTVGTPEENRQFLQALQDSL